MRTLIVGIGALGGTIAARALAAGMPVSLAVRDAQAARSLQSLRVTGVGGEAEAKVERVAALHDYASEKFELIVLATKAHDALEAAPFLAERVESGGALLAIQNGGVSQLLGERLGQVLLGGLSNLGATMHAQGVYEQRNAGHLLIGELAGGISDRAARVANFLSGAIETRATPSLRGAIWSKLLLNCSITTLGAIAGQTMRQYIGAHGAVFRRAYDEALAVARASGVEPVRMIVDPIPSQDYARWLGEVLAAYGELKPSMLQDFERGRRTEIDFINGYVAQLGARLNVPVALNEAITALVHRIERGEARPDAAHLTALSRV